MSENELFEQLANKFRNGHEYDKKRIRSEQLNNTRHDELVDFVNAILSDHGINSTINKEQIRFYPDYVGNISDPIKDKALSTIIFNHCFPPPSLKTYFHFTSFSALKSILTQGRIRLSNLIKRYEDGEFYEFYDKHGLDGYQKGGNVWGMEINTESIMRETFYLSLSGSGIGDEKWREFANNGEGVRLEFEISTEHPDFRQVFYPTRGVDYLPLMKDLFEKIRERFGYLFNFTYSSKIGSFYLRGKYSSEDEYRFLIKSTTSEYGAYDLISCITDPSKGEAFIEIPLVSRFGEFKIVSVQPGYNFDNDDHSELESLIRRYPPISLYPKAFDPYSL